MKKGIVVFLMILVVNNLFSQQNQDEFQTKIQLSQVYFNSKDFEKAAPLMHDVYLISKNRYFFERYIDCLVALKKYDEAENEVKKEMKIQKGQNSEFLILWGYLLKIQKKDEEARQKYEEALKVIPINSAAFINLANMFIGRGEYEFAEKTYIQARNTIQQEQFYFDLASVYYYLRNYDRMMEEYLNGIRQDEKQLPRVQSYISAAISLDVNNELKDQFREIVLKRIQKEPSVTGYNRLLIWLFLVEKKFPAALRQAIALDKRTGTEDIQIMSLGQMAIGSGQYDDAQSAFSYIMGKGDKNPYYWSAFQQNMDCSYLKFILENPENPEDGLKLADQFEKGLGYMGYNLATINIIIEYAHLQAFYLNNMDSALVVLNKGLKMPGINAEQSGRLKTEMADIYVYYDDPWEATLIYSQVIDANKTISLGDDVKLKKAKLAYYLGNFNWAKAQLDVIKASTSKLTANDAMELSLLIGNNLNLDTTEVPLKMFARGDLLFFRHKNQEAQAVFDSIAEMFPYHTLVDDILYRKSKIETERKNYLLAAVYLQKIVDDFSYESLADDALFTLAELYSFQLNNKEKAKELYNKLLLDYPGSVFVDESRLKYRELREIFPDVEPEFKKEKDIEDLFIRNKS